MIDNLKADCQLNGDRGNRQDGKNCPKYEWKEVKDHSFSGMKLVEACSIVNQNMAQVVTMKKLVMIGAPISLKTLGSDLFWLDFLRLAKILTNGARHIFRVSRAEMRTHRDT